MKGLVFGSFMLIAMLSLWQLRLNGLALGSAVPAAWAAEVIPLQGPMLELSFSGAINTRLLLSETRYFLKADCRADGFGFMLDPETAHYSLGLRFASPAALEQRTPYTLAPGLGNMTISLPAQEGPARVFEAQAGLFQLNEKQASFEVYLQDGGGIPLVASGRWHCP